MTKPDPRHAEPWERTIGCFNRAKEAESVMANRRPGERGPIVRVALNSLFKQAQDLTDVLSR